MATSPFALLISGRPVLTNPQIVSETECAFSIPSNPPFSHIVVFLLPGMTLPPDTAAAVYVQIPPAPDFKLLGAIANEKQSAVFRISGVKSNNAGGGSVDVDAMVDETPPATPGAAQQPSGTPVTIGISVEPAAQVAANLAAQKPGTSNDASTGQVVKHQPQPATLSTPELAEKIIQNAFNYLASFGEKGKRGDEVVPLKAFKDWWDKFRTKIQNDPGFLDREGG